MNGKIRGLLRQVAEWEAHGRVLSGLEERHEATVKDWERHEDRAKDLLMLLAAELGSYPGTNRTVADLDGTDDEADWLVVGHVLDAYEVEFIRSLPLPHRQEEDR